MKNADNKLKVSIKKTRFFQYTDSNIVILKGSEAKKKRKEVPN